MKASGKNRQLLVAAKRKQTFKQHSMILKYLLTTFFSLFTISLSFGQDTSIVIKEIEHDLISYNKTITEILKDTSLMYLHSLTSFREVIKRNANDDEIEIVSDIEPGIRILVQGMVINEKGNSLSDILVYFYHTSDKGWYSDTAVHILKNEGDHRHSRLFGYVKTDANGKFVIKTIRPNGYPKSDLAAHIHIQMWKEDGTLLSGVPGELQFDDDVRMTDQRRNKSLSEGFLISKNMGTKDNPVYNYVIKSTEE